jgi:protein disulfide-isomerase-like protein
MTLLFLAETWAFARSSIATEIALDGNTQSQIALNFNVTFFDLACEYLSVDVWDVLGTNRQNVTKNVEKWETDHTGRRILFAGRNREARVLKHQEHDVSLESLHEDGVHAVSLTKDDFQTFLDENESAFIDFYAPWCIWCQRLHPTWEMFAEEVENQELPVAVGKVDCVEEAELCKKQEIRAFPTLRWFEKGKATGDYKQDRTVDRFVDFSKQMLDQNKHAIHHDHEKKIRRMAAFGMNNGSTERPGCQVSGVLMVNRVPGNFHIEAKSVNHNLNAAMTNLTHKVNSLSFGTVLHDAPRSVKRALKSIPNALQKFSPMDDTMYTTKEYHQAWHHYIKVVSTYLKGSGSMNHPLYQFLEQSQVVLYTQDNVPEARFSYDFSPMSVVVERQGRKWYDYLTSLCAIIGGTFTTLGLIDATLYKVLKPKKL